MPSFDSGPLAPSSRSIDAGAKTRGLARPPLQAWVPLVFVIAALVWAWPIALQPGAIPFAPRVEFSDLLVSHWPNAEYLRQSVWQWHELPLWNRWRLGGMPFAADPLSGLWYPPNWLLLFLPLNYGFNVLLVLHLALAGWGMYEFQRSLGFSTRAAVLGGLVFGGAPKLVAHLAAGHVSLVQAVAWTPWLMLVMQKAAHAPGWRRGAIAGGVLAVLFFADVRGAFYAGGFALLYWAWEGQRGLRRNGRASPFGPAQTLLGLSVSFLLLTAVLTLPLIELLQHASRGQLSFADAAEFSLPPVYLLGLLIPDLGGFYEWMSYSGLAVLALAIAAVVAGGLSRREWFWPAAALLALLVSLGSNTPLYKWMMAALPGMGWLRVPPRAMFLVAFCLAVLAGRGVDLLLLSTTPRARRSLSLTTAGSLAFALLLGLAMWQAAGAITPSLAGLLVLSTAIAALVGLRMSGRLSGNRWFVLFAALALGDLLWVGSSLLKTRPAGQASAAEELAMYLAIQPGEFRVYSPSYSLPQELAADYSLEQVDGVNPLQLSSTVSFLRRASGVPGTGYSVTLPELGGDPRAHNLGAVPDLRLLGMLNARFVAAEFEVDSPELVHRATLGETRLYENPFAQGEAWLVHRARIVEDTASALAAAASGETALEAGSELRGSVNVQPVRSTTLSANRVAYGVQVEERGLLVTSEVFYPGWEAWVDGVRAPVHRVNGLLRGVALEPGAHWVEFVFRPASVFLGMAGTAGGMIVLGAALLWTGDRRSSGARSSRSSVPRQDHDGDPS